MKKLLIVALVAVAAVTLIRLADRRRVEGKGRPTIWDKLATGMEEMPEDFPPRIMFDSVVATNKATQRILEILEKEGMPSEDEPALLGASNGSADD